MVAYTIIILCAFFGCILIPLKVVADSSEGLSYEQIQQKKRVNEAISKSSFLKR